MVLLLLFCFSVMFYLFLSFAAVTLTAGHLSLYHSLLCATTALQIIITKTTNTTNPTGNKCRICICTVMCWTFTTPLVQVQLLRILRQVSAALCCSRRWRPDWWFGINKTQCSLYVCVYVCILTLRLLLLFMKHFMRHEIGIGGNQAHNSES